MLDNLQWYDGSVRILIVIGILVGVVALYKLWGWIADHKWLLAMLVGLIFFAYLYTNRQPPP